MGLCLYIMHGCKVQIQVVLLLLPHDSDTPRMQAWHQTLKWQGKNDLPREKAKIMCDRVNIRYTNHGCDWSKKYQMPQGELSARANKLRYANFDPSSGLNLVLDLTSSSSWRCSAVLSSSDRRSRRALISRFSLQSINWRLLAFGLKNMVNLLNFDKLTNLE